MKNLRANPLAKLLAVLLALALTFGVAFTGVNALYLFSSYGWNSNYSGTRLYHSTLSNYANTAWDYYLLSQETEPSSSISSTMSQEAQMLGNTNFLFELADDATGEVVLSNYNKEAKMLLSGQSNDYTMDGSSTMSETYMVDWGNTPAETAPPGDSAPTNWYDLLEKYGYTMLVYYDRSEMWEITEVDRLMDYEDRQSSDDGVLYGLAQDGDLVFLSASVIQDIIRDAQLMDLLGEDNNTSHNYIMAYCVLSDMPISDEFSANQSQVSSHQDEITAYVVICGVCGVLLLAVLVFLMYSAGWKRDEEGQPVCQTNGFDRLWLEPLTLVTAACIGFCLLGCVLAEDATGQWKLVIAAWSVLAAVGMGALLPLLMSFATRIKCHALWRSTFCYALVGWLSRRGKDIWRLVTTPFKKLNLTQRLQALWDMAHENFPLAGRVLLAYLVFMILTWWMLNPHSSGFGILLWLVLNFAVLVAVEYWALYFWDIRKGAREIAAGNVDYTIPAEKMPSDLKDVAEQLNHISEGVALAVEERMKSERFRAELITNVSHDLKTPLTSIINYIDLLKKTDVQDETAREYIEVLDRKSQRLKKLTEDLVEASKASTGSINTHLETLNLTQLISQALGEYDEKLTSRRLTPVVTQPEEPVMVRADGHHLWRVMDNLLNNCVKYAMPGTRLYLALSVHDKLASVTLKNISEQPLNLTEEELMERFVRGDSSRTTEGSGLGLSIAQSLMQLQQGSFHLQVDGDLFKATFQIPLAEAQDK